MYVVEAGGSLDSTGEGMITVPKENSAKEKKKNHHRFFQDKFSRGFEQNQATYYS